MGMHGRDKDEDRLGCTYMYKEDSSLSFLFLYLTYKFKMII